MNSCCVFKRVLYPKSEDCTGSKWYAFTKSGIQVIDVEEQWSTDSDIIHKDN